MDLKLGGKSALVTGASQGIGLACAQSLAAEGCHLHLAARSAAKLRAVAEAIGREHAVCVTPHACDLSVGGEAEKLAARCREVDVLVNNAGAIPRGSLREIAEGAWRRAWDLKVFGYVNLTRCLYQEMCRRGTGAIINIVGVSGVRPNADSLPASMGNAALIALTRALGGESAAYGVRVVSISPGFVATERTRNLTDEANTRARAAWGTALTSLPFGRMADPREIGDCVAFFASARASYVNGTDIDVDGGMAIRA